MKNLLMNGFGLPAGQAGIESVSFSEAKDTSGQPVPLMNKEQNDDSPTLLKASVETNQEDKLSYLCRSFKRHE